jgi:tellurite resistance protein
MTITSRIHLSSSIAETPLQYLPISLFGSVMGLTGLSAAWHLAQQRFDFPSWISGVIGAVAVLTFVALTCAYTVKWIGAPDKVRAEFEHPVSGNFFGTFLISLLLVPIVLAPVALRLSQAMWAIGAIGMVLFAWRMVDRWTTTTQLPAHATPAWIIPVVGLLDIPIAMPSLELPPMPDVMVFGLAVGLFFAVPVFTLVVARLLFQEALPPALQPTLLILVVPFAVGLSTYVIVSGHVDLFARSLYMVTVFLLAVFIGRLRYLLRSCPFRTGWWAVSFPLSASAIAALRIAASEDGRLTDGMAIGLLLLATAVIAWLAGRTLLGIAQGELKTLIG